MSTTRFTGVLTLAACAWLAPALTMAASSTGPQGFGHVHALLVHPQDETLLVGTHHGFSAVVMLVRRGNASRPRATRGGVTF